MEKIIHQIVGPNQNDIIRKSLASWEVLKSFGYRLFVWDDESIAHFLAKYYLFAGAAFLNARNHAEAADIARYLIVYHFGGYYLDWDIELLNAELFLDIVYNSPNGFLVIDPVNGTLASECFAAKKKEPYLHSLTNDIVELFASGKRDTMFTPQYSGPYKMRDSLSKHNNSTQRLIPVKDIFLYDYWEIRNPPKKTIQRPLIHYWLHTWIK